MAKYILNAWDIMNTPEVFHSNMESSLCKENVSCILLPQHNTNQKQYVGFDLIHSDVDVNNIRAIKFAYKATQPICPTLLISSPAYSASILPVNTGVDDDYLTAVFDVEATVKALLSANTTSKSPYSHYDGFAINDINVASLNSRYLRIALHKFSKCDHPECELKYAGFFDSIDEALSYSANDNTTDFEGAFQNENYKFIELTDDIHEQYTTEMEKRILDIKYNTKDIDPKTIKGTCYYISSANGNDDNNGLSPQTPWRTLKNLYVEKPAECNYLNECILSYGDAVFLERGSVFYPTLHTRGSGDYVLSLNSGCTLAAYGDGEKPILTGAIDINGSKDWVKTEYENVWALDQRIEKPSFANCPGYSDVGHIVFIKHDGTIGNGIKVLPTLPMTPYCEGSVTVDNGIVSTGFEIYDSASRECKSPDVLKNELEFFHNWENDTLYLYCSQGNPAEVFKSVIVARCVKAIFSFEVKDILVDNIAVKYIGAHGMQFGDAKNVTLQNCTIEWIGGSTQGGRDTVRYGNGVENWGSCDGFYILNTFVDQVYDGGLSTQFSSGKDSCSIMNDLKINDCVVTNTNSNIELWNYAEAVLCSNFEMKRNYLAYGGYHFGHQRPKKNGSLVYLGRFPGQLYENSIFEGNVLMHASFELYCGRPFRARGASNGTIVKNNVYIQSTDYRLGGVPEDYRNDSIGHDVCDNCATYNEETISRWHNAGLDLGSTFYYYDGPFAEEERTHGLYRMRDDKRNIIK